MKALFGFRLAMCAWCIGYALQGHPPAKAQLSNEDVAQDLNIAAINKHIDNTDLLVSNLGHEVDRMTGGIEVFCWITGLLTAGSIVVQVRGKRP